MQTTSKDGSLDGGEGKAGKGSVKSTSNPPLTPDNVHKPTSDKQTQQDILNPIPQSNVSAPLMINQPIAISGAKSSDPDDYIDHYAPIRPKRQPRVWTRDIRGFRAFLDYGYVHGVGKEKNYRFEYSGSIGFQFNPIFYTGVGTGYYITLNNKDASMPIFLNPRINFLDEYKTPFLDVKVGYSVREGKGFYFSSSLGMSFTKKGKRAFNLGLFYALQNAKYYGWTGDEPPVRKEFKPTYHGIGIRLSYEFGLGR